jgi:carboxymethylenebutenolidase
VAWYGPVKGPVSEIQPHTPVERAATLHCPLLGLYGGQDKSISQVDVRQAASNARDAGHVVDIVVFPDAGHGFHADYRNSYNQADAEKGWAMMLDWFRKNGVA